MPVPVLRLPYLALKEVLEAMPFRQLFILSLCSKRMNQAVKDLRGKSIKTVATLSGTTRDCIKFILSIQNSNEVVGFVDGKQNGVPEDGWRTDAFQGALFKECLDFRSYWEDVEVGVRSFLDYLSNLFDVRVKLLNIRLNLLWIADLIEQRQGPRTYAIYTRERDLFTDEQFRHLLVDLNPETLELKTQPSPHFRIENFQKKYNFFHVFAGNWFTRENLLTLDCVGLELRTIRFSAADINRFFRHVLLEGAAPRLCRFQAQVYDGDENGILEGIRGVLAPIPGRDQLDYDFDSWSFCGTFERGGKSRNFQIMYRQWDEINLGIWQ